ncbi:MAG: enoyl-CoA hydratase/isomerase family protein [Acidimicrobiia bacterium]
MTGGDAEVLTDDEGPIRVITLNRPARLNAFTADGYRLLAHSLRDADDAPGVHVVLIQGAGRAFSSGVDLDAFRSGDHGAFASGFGELLDVLLGLRKPLVAAVHGPAVGFGATLLLHCDVVLVADDARLRFPFTKLGTAPEAGSSWLLPATVGAQRAAELLLTSRWVSSAEAVELGLAARVVPAAELAARSRDVAHQMAAHPLPAVVAAKRLLKMSARTAVPVAIGHESEAGRSLAEELGGL